MTVPTPKASRCNASSINGTVSTGFTKRIYARSADVQTHIARIMPTDGHANMALFESKSRQAAFAARRLTGLSDVSLDAGWIPAD